MITSSSTSRVRASAVAYRCRPPGPTWRPSARRCGRARNRAPRSGDHRRPAGRHRRNLGSRSPRPGLLEHRRQRARSWRDSAAAIRLDGTAADAVAIEVRNAGAIPADRLSTIFDPFLPPSRTDPRAGLGLGLYIADQIVHAHGGSIEASTPDATTLFRIVIPRVRPPPRTCSPKLSRAVRRPRRGGRASGRGEARDFASREQEATHAEVVEVRDDGCAQPGIVGFALAGAISGRLDVAHEAAALQGDPGQTVPGLDDHRTVGRLAEHAGADSPGQAVDEQRRAARFRAVLSRDPDRLPVLPPGVQPPAASTATTTRPRIPRDSLPALRSPRAFFTLASLETSPPTRPTRCCAGPLKSSTRHRLLSSFASAFVSEPYESFMHGGARAGALRLDASLATDADHRCLWPARPPLASDQGQAIRKGADP